ELRGVHPFPSRRSSDLRIGMRNASQHIIFILEQIGVNRSDRESQLARMIPKLPEIVHLIPRNMDGNGRTHPGHLMDLGGVFQLLDRKSTRLNSSHVKRA